MGIYKPFILNKFVQIFKLKEIYNMIFICEDMLNEKCICQPQQHSKLIYQELEITTPYKSNVIRKMRKKYDTLYNNVYEQIKHYDNNKLQLIEMFLEYKQIDREHYNELIIKLSPEQREKTENIFVDFAFNEIKEKYHNCNDLIYECEEKFKCV